MLSRRNFIGSGALAAAAFGSGGVFVPAGELPRDSPASGVASPIRLGLASYTFRNFNRTQMIDLEYETHPDDPMPGVIASFAYMRGVLAGRGYASQV